MEVFKIELFEDLIIIVEKDQGGKSLLFQNQFQLIAICRRIASGKSFE